MLNTILAKILFVSSDILQIPRYCQNNQKDKTTDEKCRKNGESLLLSTLHFLFFLSVILSHLIIALLCTEEDHMVTHSLIRTKCGTVWASIHHKLDMFSILLPGCG